MANVNNNDVVYLELDRPRMLRYGHSALKTYQALSGVSLEDMGEISFNIETIEQLVYAGLLTDARKHGEILTIEKVEELLDEHSNFQETIDKVTEALDVAFASTGKKEPDSTKVAGRKQRQK